MIRALKVGDRVKVEFEAEVRPAGELRFHNDSWVTVLIDGSTDGLAVVRRRQCTVIVPPVKVGDVVTEDNIGQLTPGSLVAEPDETPYWLSTNGEAWIHWSGGSYFDANYVASRRARVLRVGGGE